MLNISLFEKNPLFQKHIYKKDELVFDEWEVNENLYLVKSGKLAVEKYTTDERNEVKELAALTSGNFFWEAALNSSDPKEARIRALEDTELIFINGKIDLLKYLESSPQEAFYLFSFIISESNKRVLAANRQIIANYEVDKTINEIEKIDSKSIFFLIDKIRSIVGCSYLLFLEKNPYVTETMILKYDTRLKWRAQDLAITFSWDFPPEDFRKNKVYVSRFNMVVPLMIGQEILWYLVYGHNLREFNDAEKKTIIGISISLTGIIHQKRIIDEERNKNYIKGGSI